MLRSVGKLVTDVGEIGDGECFSLRIDCLIDWDWKCVIDVLSDLKSNGCCVALAPKSDETAFECCVRAAYCAAAHINWPG